MKYQLYHHAEGYDSPENGITRLPWVSACKPEKRFLDVEVPHGTFERRCVGGSSGCSSGGSGRYSSVSGGGGGTGSSGGDIGSGRSDSVSGGCSSSNGCDCGSGRRGGCSGSGGGSGCCFGGSGRNSSGSSS
ncbi:keratin, type II cytoskeletal 1-like [Mercenaria mercenaria]|uniref:keratin, type II cytoskeletal 1-like n=1 Tax=Mercenaria mercenaria TaxID=6596 RepID=UPI00234E52B1|nr:keratin, type II cytoskeletal 1-like [Mercenaria mercenaria]